MKLYYHHVGKKGASEDFKKTVFARVPVSLVEHALPDHEPNKRRLLDELNEHFPIGSFNCWGVPSGAAIIIRNLSVGDAVLLVESVSEYGGNIPALGEVKVFIRQEFPSLSYAFWGRNHFPYIFFFETEPLEFQWIDFLHDMGYGERWNPQGKFMPVSNDALENVNGVASYIKYLRFRKLGKAIPVHVATEYLEASVREEPAEYQSAAQNELKKILDESELGNAPALTDDNIPEPVYTKVIPRDAAFRSQIRLIYGERCCVCGSNRCTPDGSPEVEGAHIYPKRLKGQDITQNGISLCKLHHWAFDCGWFAIADDLTILVHTNIPRTTHYAFVTDHEDKKIAVPENVKDHPHPVFLAAHRKLHGFE